MKIIKENIYIVYNFAFSNFNNSLFSSNFPSELRHANMTPIFSKKDSLSSSLFKKGVCKITCTNT